MRFYQSKGALRVKVPLSIYNRDVIFKCFYWYTGEYDIEINEDSNKANILISGKSDTKFDFDELADFHEADEEGIEQKLLDEKGHMKMDVLEELVKIYINTKIIFF